MTTKNKKVILKRSRKEYVVLNIKTHKFVDDNGNESNYDYSSFDSAIGPQEIIDELKALSKQSNKKSRTIKKNLKNYKIVRLWTQFEVV